MLVFCYFVPYKPTPTSMKHFFLLFIGLCSGLTAWAQSTFPVNGVYDKREGLYALTNATIYTTYNQKIEKATLLVRNGRVAAVGTSVSIPKGTVTIDLGGKFIYPSFIDPYTAYGLPESAPKGRKWTDPPQMVSDKKGAYGWNQAIKPETNAVESFSPDDKAAKTMRGQGFGAVLTHYQDGIARGTGTVVVLGSEAAQESILKDRAAACYSLNKGASTQDYPDSEMGAIALLRQTYLDAQWYAQAAPKGAEFNLSLDAWNKTQNLPQIFDAQDWLAALHADKIADEFGVSYIIKGHGDEYQRAAELKATGASFIIPLQFPDAYDVEDPLDASNVSLADMKHWELAPANLAVLEKNGINFALTTAGLKETNKFGKCLQQAIKRGLSKEAALKALTITPATMLGMQQQLGSLEVGKIANFLIMSGELFGEKTELYENWVMGKQHVLKTPASIDLRGYYTLKTGNVLYQLNITGESPDELKTEIALTDSLKIPVTQSVEQQNITLGFDTTPDSTRHAQSGKGFVRLAGWISADGKQWKGKGQLANGKWVEWTAIPREAPKKDDANKTKTDDKAKTDDKTKDKDTKDKEIYGLVTYPFNGYGWTEIPKAETVLFKNATVWTNEQEGILTETDVLIQNGKIAQVGKNLSLPAGGKSIDAKGKHITCGVIDEHSHIAIRRGVNEGTQSCSSEVRIGDVVDSEDVNIYRQLAGGVTTSQLLHGSANPIGGQATVIKLRWGFAPEKMKMEGAAPFIKFALGENVKQSNWGDNNTVRFPQTRMGVEQVYIDYFTRAREYGQQLSGTSSNNKNKAVPAPSNLLPLRRDLELEALNEILNKKRFITCHSYVQSEITMLMRVAEQFGFKINTFTHILEGYKVADKMKAHGVNASSFSDWWAYKHEVYDAIPYNGAILQQVGVNTAFNSDDAEMARRLNQEAAKAIKYGKVSPEEAWKFVTLNPAKMLHIDNRVGSIKIGKDADVVLWSDNPLSVYAQALQTYIDGICFYDKERDATLRQQIESERNRISQKMIGVKKGGGNTQAPPAKKRRQLHCTDHGSYEYQGMFDDHSEGH